MTPTELAELIDSIPEIAAMVAEYRAAKGLRPMDDMLMEVNPETLVIVWPNAADKKRGVMPEIVEAWEAATNPLMDDALGWTPIITPEFPKEEQSDTQT